MVQSFFKSRELLLGGKSNNLSQPAGLVEQPNAWGWAVLEGNPGREIAFGAVTQPWNANPTFRGFLPAVCWNHLDPARCSSGDQSGGRRRSGREASWKPGDRRICPQWKSWPLIPLAAFGTDSSVRAV